MMFSNRKKEMNVAEKANEFLAEIEKDGSFNDVDLEYVERETVWHREYAIFIISFDTFDLPYFDVSRFDEDFKKHMESWFSGCEIKYYPSCNEYEIIGSNYKKYWAKHAEAVEEFSDAHSDEKYLIYTG